MSDTEKTTDVSLASGNSNAALGLSSQKGLASGKSDAALGLSSQKNLGLSSTRSTGGPKTLPPLLASQKSRPTSANSRPGSSKNRSRPGTAAKVSKSEEIQDLGFEARLNAAAVKGRMLEGETEDEPGSSVMISHSRSDAAFVMRLRKALENDQDRHVWVDNDDTTMDDDNDDWMDRIYTAIEQADCFLAVLSPQALDSEVCNLETEHALKHSKRIVPIVCINVNFKQVRKEVAHLNWIFFRDDGDDFNKSLKLLLKTIDEEKMHCKHHTRILTRAIYWEKIEYERSALLRGKDLRRSQEWLNESALGKEPKPTKLQMSFISSSRQLFETMKRRNMIALFFFFIVVISTIFPTWGVFFFCLVFSHAFIWYASGY